MNKLDISQDEIKRLYWDDGLSQPGIAKKLGCSTYVVRCYMEKHNIPRRSVSASQKSLGFTKELLEDLYLNKELSTAEIGNMLECSRVTILKYIDRFGIPHRTASEPVNKIKTSKEELYDLYWNREMSSCAIADMLHCDKTSVLRRMRGYGISSRDRLETMKKMKLDLSRDELTELYLDKELSSLEIADMFSCHHSTILERLIEFGVQRRRVGAGSLEKSPAWKGGISFEPYCPKFNESFKESIREKFGRVCFLCPTTEEENGRKLAVHHVSYNKDCLCDDSDCEFVPLCLECHGNSNHDREYWEAVIMEKLEAIKCESGL